MRRLLPLIAGALGLVAVNLTWADVSGGGQTIGLSGVEVTWGLGQALTLTLLAGWLALLVLRGALRVAMVGLIGLIGVAMILVAVFGHSVDPAAAEEKLRTVSLGDASIATMWWGPVLFGIAGLCAIIAAALLLRTQASSNRFERPTQRTLTTWEELDAGTDPTVGGVDADEGPEWAKPDREDDQ